MEQILIVFLLLVAFVKDGRQVKLYFVEDVEDHKEDHIDKPEQTIDSVCRVDKIRNVARRIGGV